jgi:hypothetical protein
MPGQVIEVTQSLNALYQVHEPLVKNLKLDS